MSGQLLVAELQRVLMEHELTCHRTCFSLQIGGNTLDGLTKLRDIQSLQDQTSIKVVEGNCTPSLPYSDSMSSELDEDRLLVTEGCSIGLSGHFQSPTQFVTFAFTSDMYVTY